MNAVEICEVSPRDGLQNEDILFSTDQKIELIQRAIDAGARRIEAVSFVDPRRVPQMADAEAVAAALPHQQGVRYAGLVLNARGLDRALAAGMDEINLVVVATDTFCRRNQGTTTQQSIMNAITLAQVAASSDVRCTITIAVAFGCPFEGEVPAARIRGILEQLGGSAADEIALADTIGVGVPAQVTERLALARELFPDTPLRLHLHDTRHTAVANAFAALQAGVATLDASIGGLGGCPFAPNATGNVATEDLVYAFDRSNVTTGFDLAAVTDTTARLESILGRKLPGALLRAGGFPDS